MEPMPPNSLIVHYHEIALKGDNRPLFVRQLIENMQKATRSLGVQKIVAPRGRLLIFLEEGADWNQIVARLKVVFGIANYAPAWRRATRYETIEETIAALVAQRSFSSFKIAARRGDKSYPIRSQELNERLGRFVQERTGARVDLEAPERTFFVEILPREALIYVEKFRGAGGLPVGVSGPIAALLSGGIDSPVAAQLMMKRGCTVSFIHFHSHPYVTRASWEKAEELVEHLTPYQFHSRLYAVPFGELQREIVTVAPPALRVVLYRRFMVRIAQELALREGAKALLTGESVGQVASQTLENLAVIQEVATLPILRPLIGFNKDEIIAVAQEIGTYSISIQPDQDCCRLFIPPHPAVRARLEDLRRAEAKLDIDGLVKQGLGGIAIREFRFGEG
ncbi:MAG: tRNA 4-thiouridine(8) synthase ThiI [Nitrospirae bacterium]|nr:tRNA 4-thiouridine(8) synthase ThiI [Candidatus Manganitrophaceae bacterium]